jgi:hypothetical protein
VTTWPFYAARWLLITAAAAALAGGFRSPGRPPKLLALLAHDRGGRFSRMPTPPRSSMKVHSAAIRLTTSSGVNIDAIASP